MATGTVIKINVNIYVINIDIEPFSILIYFL